jgi:hypothetical protein
MRSELKQMVAAFSRNELTGSQERQLSNLVADHCGLERTLHADLRRFTGTPPVHQQAKELASAITAFLGTVGAT